MVNDHSNGEQILYNNFVVPLYQQPMNHLGSIILTSRQIYKVVIKILYIHHFMSSFLFSFVYNLTIITKEAKKKNKYEKKTFQFYSLFQKIVINYILIILLRIHNKIHERKGAQ